MDYVIHVTNTMWRIKNQAFNSTSCIDNALGLLVLVSGRVYWGLQVTSSFLVWDCISKGCFGRGMFWRAKSHLKGIEDFNLEHCNYACPKTSRALVCCPLLPRSHQTFYPALVMILLGIMCRNRCQPATLHTIIIVAYVERWCQKWLVWSTPQPRMPEARKVSTKSAEDNDCHLIWFDPPSQTPLHYFDCLIRVEWITICYNTLQRVSF